MIDEEEATKPPESRLRKNLALTLWQDLGRGYLLYGPDKKVKKGLRETGVHVLE